MIKLLWIIHFKINIMNHAELIVALDVPNKEEMEKVLSIMPDSVTWYKVGLELFVSEGPSILKVLKNLNKSIFLDLKLHDIPQTVSNTIKLASDFNVDFLTVHTLGGKKMLSEAVMAAKAAEHPPKLIGVTTLTSLNEDDLIDIGINRSISDQAISLGKLAINQGIDGLVTSAHEVKALKFLFPNALLITPGIRMNEDVCADQKRIATPSFAVRQGASHIVMGRSILQSQNPLEKIDKIFNDIHN